MLGGLSVCTLAFGDEPAVRQATAKLHNRAVRHFFLPAAEAASLAEWRVTKVPTMMLLTAPPVARRQVIWDGLFVSESSKDWTKFFAHFRTQVIEERERGREREGTATSRSVILLPAGCLAFSSSSYHLSFFPLWLSLLRLCPCFPVFGLWCRWQVFTYPPPQPCLSDCIHCHVGATARAALLRQFGPQSVSHA